MRYSLLRKFSVQKRTRPQLNFSVFSLVEIAVAALFVLSAFTQISGAYSGNSPLARSRSGSSALCSVTSSAQEEKYILTYAVSAQNHQRAWAITGADVYQNVVTGSNKVYLLVHVRPSTTFTINTSGTTKTCAINLSKQTDNIYWDALSGTTGSRDYATVGGDLIPDSSTGLMLFDQYINVNSAPGGRAVTSQTTSSPGPSCYVDTSGQERNSVYMLFVDDSNIQHSYVISGTAISEISVGGVDSTAFYVYLSSNTIGTGTSPGKTNACSMSLSTGIPDFEWAVRAPPAGAPVSGNYGIYGTLGGNCPPNNEGTNAGIIEQFTDSSYQFP
jgi:hypothetical protein